MSVRSTLLGAAGVACGLTTANLVATGIPQEDKDPGRVGGGQYESGMFQFLDSCFAIVNRLCGGLHKQLLTSQKMTRRKIFKGIPMAISCWFHGLGNTFCSTWHVFFPSSLLGYLWLAKA